MNSIHSAANILLVDDSALNVMALVDILESRGHRVRVASDGSEALREVEKETPEIILLDIFMPEMDGFEVCERLKADKQTHQIPIVFLSAVHDLSQKTKAFAAGGVDYITKPFQPEEVLSRLETHLAIGRLQKELERKNTALQKKIRVHKRDKAELRQYRDHLEELVKVRTEALQQEIAERKQTEFALLESQKEWERTFDTIPDPIAIIDKNHRIVRLNQAMRNRLQGVPEKMLTHPCYMLVHGTEHPPATCPYTRLLEDGCEHTVELYEERLQGYFVVKVSPFYEPDGELGGCVHVLHDISERKNAEAERLRLETQLRQTQRLEALGTLSGGIAHDFNNILGTMQGYTEFLLRKMPEESRERVYLERIFQAGKRATELVRRILAFSRAHEQQLIPTDITPLVKETLEMLRATIPANIKIRHSIQADCSPIMADGAQIHQVLMNVCLNARQAMQEQGGTLEVILREVIPAHEYHEMVSERAEETCLQLTVKDSGPGMSQKIKERIFDPFFTTRATSGGTGLGLSVVHGIIKGHGGEIWVESEPQKGTMFHFFFPLASGESKRDDSSGTTGQKSVTTAHPAAPSKGDGRILLVDDERDLSELYRMILTAQGYHVTVSHDGEEALQLFRASPDSFDLVFTDQNMPDMTGERLVRELLTFRKDLPIILATGYSETLNREKALALGVRKFLMKPVETRKLLDIVHAILEESDERRK